MSNLGTHKKCKNCLRYGHFLRVCRSSDRFVKEVDSKNNQQDEKTDDELLVSSITINEIAGTNEWM